MTVKQMKAFFGTPTKPVTFTELTNFKKADPQGFEEIHKLVIKHFAEAESEVPMAS